MAAIFSEGPTKLEGGRFRRESSVRERYQDRSRFYRIYIRYHDKSLKPKIKPGPSGGGGAAHCQGPPQSGGL